MQEPQRLMATDIVALVRNFWPAPMNWYGFEYQSRYQRPILPDAATRRIRRRRSGQWKEVTRHVQVSRFAGGAYMFCNPTILACGAIPGSCLEFHVLDRSFGRVRTDLLLCQFGIMLRPRSINPPPLLH